MADLFDNPRLAAARDRALAISRSHRVRKWTLIAAIVLVIYGLLGFLAAPPVLRSQIEKRAGALIGRAVTIGHVRFDPYTLRLQLDQLHIAGSDGKTPFVDVDQSVVNVSWTSLFRMAPVLDALILQRPRIRIVRLPDRRFNFSDIIDRLAARPVDPNAAPARYSLSNISVHDGDITFDDEPAGTTHHIEALELGIPFIANLPRDTDVYVQPLLALRIDGSPLRMTGQTRPFAHDRESIIDFEFSRLDLPRYLGYVPAKLPFSVPKGLLGGKLQLHFVQTTSTPQLRLTGSLEFDDFILDSNRQQPILALKHGSIQLADVQPLQSRYAFGTISLDGARLQYIQTAPGHSNLDSLVAPSVPASRRKPAPNDLRIAALVLRGSAVDYTDTARDTLAIANLAGSIHGLSLLAAPPARFDLSGQLAGGTVNANGTLDLAASKLAATLGLQQVGLAALQDVAGLRLATPISTGELAAKGQVQLDWGAAFNLHLAGMQATVSQFALQAEAGGHAAPIALDQLAIAIDALDLASREAKLGAISASGLRLDVQRDAAGRINLLELVRGKPDQDTARDKAPPWHWSVAHVGFDHAAIALTDFAAGNPPVRVKLDVLDGSVDGLGSKLDAPSAVKLSGAIGRGTFALSGTLWPSPLRADLQVGTRRLDIAAFEPYIGVPLNVTLSHARITSQGKLRYDARGAQPSMAYRGDAALENVRIQDKLTGDDFLRWRELDASGIDAAYGSGALRASIGNLALRSFYARMIINASGRLNLSDVIANPNAAPVSVTRANNASRPGQRPAGPTESAPAAAGVATASTTAASATATTVVPAADIHIGGITLADGQLNFTDNFIKPNYTANLLKLHGRIGAFGTTPNAPPAPITVQASLDDNAPVDIGGTLNPLQPVAVLDIKGTATGVELKRLSAYSTHYTGYPIIDGKLTANVQYKLDHRKLDGDNHIFITQLTFGNRDESPGIRHLPVKLAVALLKDPQGNIDVNLPVSGSLDNPQFSVGGLVWRAIVNLIGKAITAPFRLLGAAFGGHGGDLDYVAFAPGSAVLDDDAQALLGKIVAMLAKKPSLVMDITGYADPARDKDGLRKVTVEDLVRREMLLDTQGRHADVSPAALAKARVTPDQYEKYLKRAYRHDNIKDKPRNFLGLKKTPPPNEMRSLMEANVATGDEAMRELATRRAAAVQAWLKGKLADQRVVVKPPRLGAAGIDDKGPTTRAQFGLQQH